MNRLVIFFFLGALVSCGGGGGGTSTSLQEPVASTPPSSSPVIDSFPELSVMVGELAAITVSATDADGTISGYQWIQTSGNYVQLINADSQTVSFVAPNSTEPDTVGLTVTVTDNDGNSASEAVTIEIVSMNYSVSPHQQNFVDDQDLLEFFAFFDHKNINRIDLFIKESEWQGFLEELKQNIDSDVYFKSDAIISTAKGKTTLTDTGFRIRGNTTRQLPQQNGEFKPVHFKLKFNKIFDQIEGTLDYVTQRNRRFANLRSINLKSRFPGFDDSQIRELYGYDLFNQVGINAPLTGSVHLYLTIGDRTINYGIYTAIEPIDKTFLRKRYGDDNNEGNLYKCGRHSAGPANLLPMLPGTILDKWVGVGDKLAFDPIYDLKTNEDEANHQVLIDFIANLNQLDGVELQRYLDQHFEVDKFLRFLAMNMLIGMPDDYWATGNNYYLYFNNNGKVEFIPYDYDKGFGGGADILVQTDDVLLADIFTWVNLNLPSDDPIYDLHPLVDKLLAISSYRQKYKNYLRHFTDPINGNFDFASYSSKFAQLKVLYDPDGDDFLLSDIPDNVPFMDNREGDYFRQKIESVRNQLGL